MQLTAIPCYAERNLEMKEKARARREAPDIKLKRFRASDDSMTFLRTLEPCKAPRLRARLSIQRTAVPGPEELRIAVGSTKSLDEDAALRRHFRLSGR